MFLRLAIFNLSSHLVEQAQMSFFVYTQLRLTSKECFLELNFKLPLYKEKKSNFELRSSVVRYENRTTALYIS